MVGAFSLHAGPCIDANDRERLERLCQYVARPALRKAFLEQAHDGRIIFSSKTLLVRRNPGADSNATAAREAPRPHGCRRRKHTWYLIVAFYRHTAPCAHEWRRATKWSRTAPACSSPRARCRKLCTREPANTLRKYHEMGSPSATSLHDEHFQLIYSMEGGAAPPTCPTEPVGRGVRWRTSLRE